MSADDIERRRSERKLNASPVDTTPPRASTSANAGQAPYASTSKERMRNPFEDTPPKDKRTGNRKKRTKKKVVATTPLDAFLFPASEELPEIVSVPCQLLSHEFEGSFLRPKYKSFIGTHALFQTVPTWRGLFLVVYAEENPEDVLPVNRCIARLSEGRARNWNGNVLVVKEVESGSGLLGGVSMDDLGVFRSFFALEGNAPCKSGFLYRCIRC